MAADAPKAFSNILLNHWQERDLVWIEKHVPVCRNVSYYSILSLRNAGLLFARKL